MKTHAFVWARPPPLQNKSWVENVVPLKRENCTTVRFSSIINQTLRRHCVDVCVNVCMYVCVCAHTHIHYIYIKNEINYNFFPCMASKIRNKVLLVKYFDFGVLTT